MVPITYNVSEEFRNSLIAATKQLMLIYNLQDSSLVNSIEWQYKDNFFILLANDYFQWVDSGRRPRARMVPIEALISWIKKKGIQPRL